MIEKNLIAPRLRNGETMPVIPCGKVPTRFEGEIVFVSQVTEEDRYYHNSPYTEKQVLELEGIRVAKHYLHRVEEKRLREYQENERLMIKIADTVFHVGMQVDIDSHDVYNNDIQEEEK